MSRIANKPIVIPNGVEVKVENNVFKVKGPKGELSQEFLPYIKIEVNENEIYVKPNLEFMKRKSDLKKMKMFTGTYWRLFNNMIIGVTQGFRKELEIIGIGYRAQLQGKKLVMNLGYAHPVEMEIPSDVAVEVPSPNRIVVSGIDKQRVGQVAADIRRWREPNVYSGKGIRYVGEVVRLKEGKKA
ncbi:50S ribosomal protein L6 [Thermosipho melanesiensis]|uniref:Large ribosomal subunit protein uL6 n=2 Tax=Thermosipho melanesiensis TaxID=46541 RepID=RL6_THEM4|nr:50S ribosomal protein L6 [Thermosipho melanesiensis]A6LLM8.1 RecName: Full=Large ribosomal subunit protein uL6; AltName: Full=50S ribosomal protein L6 [Thermosipho melanesiensis BI429]ABR30829.1 ribosomal protein L6 [Thermosipho melanesiensis BI429]APT73949.1 50S ribosomal protein L6 [Thermosipho melanesiensis]OOC35886.1 50S ribosomal protein L6 [Thermosipho melanesiensis]OOC38388.1 50S ribosomal protein L6 [Thermosipho melanesiensis]OOC38849.1 50S ribosomal protein L6 [Thermosipho melanes